MSSFRPPLRKAENEENLPVGDLCSSVSAQNSQEVLSCGFLPPKQRKRNFKPPLRELVSPGQKYIEQILQETDRNNTTEEAAFSGAISSQFELAPLKSHGATDVCDGPEVNGCAAAENAPKRRYHYQLGSRMVEQLGGLVSTRKASVPLDGKQKVSAGKADLHKFQVFEFPHSQDVEKDQVKDKPKRELQKDKGPLAKHCVSTDIHLAMKKARQEIKEIRRRYAAKKAGCFIEGPSSLQKDRQPLLVSVNFLTKGKPQLSHDTAAMEKFLFSSGESNVLLSEE